MEELIEYTDDLVDKLDFETLKEFLYQYNKYIQNFYEEHDENSYPVCMVEFFSNDFQEINAWHKKHACSTIKGVKDKEGMPS